MLLRVGVLAGAANRQVIVHLAPFLAVMVMSAGIVIWLLARRTPPAGKAPELSNPFQLKTAIKFALIYAAVLVVVEFAKQRFGSWGLMAAAVLAGLTDVDAITLALAGTSGLAAEQAAGGIALAALSNTLAKAGYASWLGRGSFRQAMLVILGIAFLAGAVALVILGPRPWATESQ
jgi:uncharacterized membrane protein (DUF4010 family)